MAKNLMIGACGPAYSPRFFIVDQYCNYWNESGWTKNLSEAGLFADPNEVAKKMHDILLNEVPGELVRFVAPVIVEIKTGHSVSLKALQAWLDKAVEVFIDARQGTGPAPESMVMLRIDWDKLKEQSK